MLEGSDLADNLENDGEQSNLSEIGP